VLAELTKVPDTGASAWRVQFDSLRARPHTYFPLVIVDTASDVIVGAGTLFIEHKFLRGLGSVGHIEDIAVSKTQRGRKLGLSVIRALTYISDRYGCYKTILNCSDDNIRQWPFFAPLFLCSLGAQLSTRSAVS